MPEVTDPNDLAELGSIGGSVGMPAAVSGFPIIQGNPKKAAPLNERDQATLTSDVAKAKADAAKAELDLATAREASGQAKTVEQAKAQSFLTRAWGANKSYEAQDIGPRSAVGQSIADSSPSFLNSLPGWIGNSPQRQVADAAQDEFIAASLRQDSGAAIPEPELERQRRIYFPMPGDGPEVIEQKRQARLRVLQGLMASSGRMADKAIAAAEQTLSSTSAAASPFTAAYDPTRPGGGAPDGDPKIRQGLSVDAVVDNLVAGNDKPVFEADGSVTVGDRSYPSREMYEQDHRERSLAAAFGTTPDDPALLDSDTYREAYRNAFGRDPSGYGRVTYKAPGVEEAEQKARADRDTAAGGADAFVRGLADVPTFGGSDELSAAMQTLFGDGTMRENLRRERAITGTDEEVNPYLRLGGQLAGALVLPTRVPGVTAARGIGAGAVQAAKEGAIYSGGYGFGSADGDLGDRLQNAGTGALTGAVAGYGLGQLLPRAANAMASRGPNPVQVERNALLQSADRLGVDMLPADVGGAATRRMTAVTAQTPLGAGPIVEAAQRTQGQLRDAARSTAAKAGASLPEDEAGQAVRRGAMAASEDARKRASRFYDMAKKRSGNVRVDAQQAIKMIDDEIAVKRQAGELSDGLIDDLEKFKRSLSQGGQGITITGIREARSALSALARTDKLRNTDANRIFKGVLNAASDDIERTLVSQGRQDAARMFKRADTLWRERIEQIDQVLEPLVGKGRSGEDILKSVEQMTRGSSGGIASLRRVMATMPKAEAGDVTATIIDRLGRAAPGAQNAAGDAFSSATFLTNWNKMSPKAKTLLFGASGDLRQNLDDVAKIAGGIKAAQKYANHSNTGSVVGGLLSGASVLGGLKTIATAAALQYGSGKVLSSQALTRWLARAPASGGPSAIKSYIERLPGIAAREPAISAEVGKMYQHLMNAVNDNVKMRSVASEEANGMDEKDPQQR